jgi:adenylosuccinate synthase
VPRSPAAEAEREVFSTPAVAERWLARCAPLARCVAPDELLAAWLASTAAVVFEGAQGVLLDESLGFHPHTTWSRCTPEGARELLAEAAPGAPLRVYGVLRAHAVRHGPGPMPSEEPALGRIVAEHNDTNPWQGPVRYGWFDAVLARYALACVPELDALAVTHVDALARRETWSACAEYAGPRGDDDLVLRSAAGRVTELVREPRPSLARQERLGRLLGRCRPELRAMPGRESDYLASLEQRLGRRIDLVSRGPRARDVEELAGADVLS